MGKGSARRPMQVSDEQFAERWDAIFWNDCYQPGSDLHTSLTCPCDRADVTDECWCGLELLECECHDGRHIKACPVCLCQQNKIKHQIKD